MTLASRHSVTAGESCDGSTVADVCDIAWLSRCDALSAVACPCALEPRAVGALAPLRRDRRRSDRRGWRSRCHDDRRCRQQVLVVRYPAPAVGLPPWYRFATKGLLLRYIAGVAGAIRTRKRRVFVGFNGQYVRSGHYGEVCDFFLATRACPVEPSNTTKPSSAETGADRAS